MDFSPRNNNAYQMGYKYGQTIGSSQLRLLKPVAISREHLTFTLLHVPRASAPPYTAVSYTWGEEAPSETISLNGSTFRVRPNLWSCLYYLGIASRNAAWNYLWVDAICINQENDNERSAQVGHMDQTYKDATCVSVWLGLVSLPDEYQPLLSNPSLVKTVEADPFDWDLSMHDLANRSYWSRIWVIQEFLLGKDVQIHCSNTQLDWMDFQEMLCRSARIDQFGDEHRGVVPASKAASFAALPLTLSRHPDKHPEFLQPLAALIISHRRAKCKNPRDRIFALLGLVSTDERELLKRFFPDYTMNENMVWIIALAHLMQYGFLEDPKLRNITPDSEDIFLGLGVGSKSLRKKLIQRADSIDYLGQ